MLSVLSLGLAFEDPAEAASLLQPILDEARKRGG